MLRTRSPVRLLTLEDRDAALELCARDPAANVYVASRILDGALGLGSTAVSGYFQDGELRSLLWTIANVVPVETDAAARSAFADRTRKVRRRCASFLGPQNQVTGLWDVVREAYPRPRAVRSSQPLLGMQVLPSSLGIELDPRVRPGQVQEAEMVLPAAEHMFTEEIGYPPYQGSPAYYLDSLRALLRKGRTYLVVEDGEVIFKADVGSLAFGCAQIQGVWLAPRLRGRGLAASMMASVVEQTMVDHAPFVTLYVNDFNAPALATYRRIGMERNGTFATILF